MLDNSLSIDTLRRAVLCDSAAMLAIVQQYTPYINRLAQRPHLGQDGMIHLIIDEDLKQELVIELLTKPWENMNHHNHNLHRGTFVQCVCRNLFPRVPYLHLHPHARKG